MAKASTAPKMDDFRLGSVSDFAAYRDSLVAARDPNQPVIVVCHGTGCQANGSPKVSEALRKVIAAAGLEARVVPLIKTTGCHGFCSRGPLVIFQPAGLFYQRVKPGDAEDIVNTTLIGGKVVERLLYHDPHTGEPIPYDHDIPFYRHQQRIILKNIGKIDPTDIRDTIAAGGYQAMAQTLTAMTPDEIINTVETSGLRGRGGGGFPTGFKWRRAREYTILSPGPVYMVGNGDEGDPGAFMDRTLMEGDPHAILEGMIIGAFALGASQGYIYVRMEYPLAVKHLGIAIEQARALGLLGKISWVRALTLISISTAAPGPLSAAKRPRFWLPSRVGWASLTSGRPIRPKKAYGVGPPLSTTWRPGPTCPTYSRRVPPGMRVWGCPTAPALKSFPWWVRSRTPGWWRCPWASPWAASSRKSAAASRVRRNSRRCRPAVPQAAVFPMN